MDMPSNSTGGHDHSMKRFARKSLQSRQHDHGSGHEEEEEEEEEMDHDHDYMGPLPVLVRGDPLNSTHGVALADWQLQYNGMTAFEINETGHSTYT
jgi:hypothetical protein